MKTKWWKIAKYKLDLLAKKIIILEKHKHLCAFIVQVCHKI